MTFKTKEITFCTGEVIEGIPLITDGGRLTFFLIITNPDTACYLHFKVYEVNGYGYALGSENLSPAEYELYCKGDIKFDGCSNVLFADRDDDPDYLHLCGKGAWILHSELMIKIYKCASEIIKNFREDAKINHIKEP